MASRCASAPRLSAFLAAAAAIAACRRTPGRSRPDAAQRGSEAVRIAPPPAHTGPVLPPANPDLARRAGGSIPSLGIVSDPGLAGPPGTCARFLACCDAIRPLAAAAPIVQTYCDPVVAARSRDAGTELQCLINLRLLATRIPSAGAMPDACAQEPSH